MLRSMPSRIEDGALEAKITNSAEAHKDAGLPHAIAWR
jgi:hypothetical protein